MRTGAILLAVLASAATAAAQQGSLQISSATQIVTADEARRAGQEVFEPDVGVTLYQPAFRFGNLFVDLHAVKRGDGARFGTTALGLRDVKIGGMTWSLTGGDSAFSPALSAYAFTNLFAPQVTFAGGNLSGFSPRSSVTITAGRVTALRNIFGSDPEGVGQSVGQFQAKVRPWPRVEIFAHGSRVRTGETPLYTSFVDAGSDAGGGVRVRPIPTVEVTADAGISRFERRGSSVREQNVTALVGSRWALARGWVEANAQRFSPGYFAVVNTPYLDREGAFAAGELEVARPLRVFGGLETFRTNLDPEAAAAASVAMPRGSTERAFAGARLHLGGRNFLTVRAEEGDRTARPSGRLRNGYDSDTGVTSAEFQTSARDVSGFARYERRENLDRANGTGTYTQQTLSTQLFGRVTRGVQIFGSAMLIQQARQQGGQTFWQGGGGLQLQVPGRQLWLRSEGLFSRTDDWGNEVDIPHELYTLGLSGQLTPRTSIALDVMLDRAPQLSGDAGPWLTRSMIRLTHRIPAGAARVPSATGSIGRRRSTGSIFGIAFADWNANGVMDPGEEPLAGMPFLYADPAADGAAGSHPRGIQVSTGKDGQFAFVNVPEGRARVGLDLAALPVDYDPADAAMRDTEARGKPREKLAFGLVPLGSIAGAVREDSDNDGVAGAEDAPVEGAVLILDEGARSEQTRAGTFRFDAVRPGAHALKLLPESLPEGLALRGDPQVEILLEREQLHREVTFLVKVEKRPEIRKVFPPKVVAKARPADPGAGAAPRGMASADVPGGRDRAARAAVLAQAAGRRPATRAGNSGSTGRDGVWYAIQLAATADRAHAWDLVRDLQALGVDAYLSEDADGLAKVRVGSYRSRAEAERQLTTLRAHATDSFIARIGAE